MDNDILKVLYSREDIQQACQKMGKQITAGLCGEESPGYLCFEGCRNVYDGHCPGD